MIRIPTLLAFIFAGGAPLQAGEWRSRDGYFAVAEPDPARFRQAPQTRPDIIEWVSNDGKLHIRIIEGFNPQNWKRERSSIDRVLFEDTWTITDSRDIFIGGLEVPRVAGRTVEKGTTKTGVRLYLIADQRDHMVFVDGEGIEGDVAAEPDAASFLASIRLLGVPFARAAPAPPPPERGLDTAGIARLIGGLGCFLLVVAGVSFLVVWVIRARTPSRSEREEDDEID